jgi:AraC-like DNA-binding protein
MALHGSQPFDAPGPTDDASAAGSRHDRDRLLSFQDRRADSPLIERVWQCRSSRGGQFSSVAASHWEMVVTRVEGKTRITIRGPETRATSAECPAGGEWIAIRFKLGTFMPTVPVGSILDRRDVDLPRATNHRFWLDGGAWEYPSYENAETFVKRLAQRGLIACDPLVDAVLHGRRHDLSMRSAQRHFLRATGLTYGAYRQIERARHATNLLTRGVAILDAVHDAGYFDQAHLTRSVKRLIGQTPREIVRGQTQLSFLYKTDAS